MQRHAVDQLTSAWALSTFHFSRRACSLRAASKACCSRKALAFASAAWILHQAGLCQHGP